MYSKEFLGKLCLASIVCLLAFATASVARESSQPSVSEVTAGKSTSTGTQEDIPLGTDSGVGVKTAPAATTVRGGDENPKETIQMQAPGAGKTSAAKGPTATYTQGGKTANDSWDAKGIAPSPGGGKGGGGNKGGGLTVTGPVTGSRKDMLKWQSTAKGGGGSGGSSIF